MFKFDILNPPKIWEGFLLVISSYVIWKYVTLWFNI